MTSTHAELKADAVDTLYRNARATTHAGLLRTSKHLLDIFGATRQAVRIAHREHNAPGPTWTAAPAAPAAPRGIGASKRPAAVKPKRKRRAKPAAAGQMILFTP